MSLFFLVSPNRDLPGMIFFILWLLHYLHRTFIYPFSQSGRDKPYPIIIVGMAFVFNCFNGFVNGYGLFHAYTYDTSWLKSWQFITGSIIFIAGFVINKGADERFRMMKKESPTGYIIPRGWLFNYISSPHYFGEIIEWGGWALMTWSLPGLAFFIFTFANLFPRAIASHAWYKCRFPDYPSNRKAVIPYVI
jgi:protein-S-isoprenylcysteine O-methyltransferase Ste14